MGKKVISKILAMNNHLRTKKYFFFYYHKWFISFHKITENNILILDAQST